MATVLLARLSQLVASAVSFLLKKQPNCQRLQQNAMVQSFDALVTITGTIVELLLVALQLIGCSKRRYL